MLKTLSRLYLYFEDSETALLQGVEWFVERDSHRKTARSIQPCNTPHRNHDSQSRNHGFRTVVPMVGRIEMSKHRRNSDSDAATIEVYQLNNVTVRPSGPESHGPYEYSDLHRGDSSTALRVVLHLVHWPVYFLCFFPIQWIVHLLRWTFRHRHFTPTGRLVAYISATLANCRKIKFLVNYDRFVLYLRASRVYTPSQIFPFLHGTTPISDSHRGEQHPLPQNWYKIRQAVYQRDNYRCTNCGAAGGPEGKFELHADHIYPRSRGGADQLYNLRTLCRSCHEARHARIFE